MSMPYAWSGNTIAHIIGKPEYMGHTVKVIFANNVDK
jgi:hypothetical protein